jgi:hypothetical protein
MKDKTMDSHINKIDKSQILNSEFSLASHYGPILGVFVFPLPQNQQSSLISVGLFHHG